jgi:hypothetical protein
MAELVAARAVENRPAPQSPWQATGRPDEDEKDPAAQETQVADPVAARAVE